MVVNKNIVSPFIHTNLLQVISQHPNFGKLPINDKVKFTNINNGNLNCYTKWSTKSQIFTYTVGYATSFI